MKKPVVLAILDGWGIGDDWEHNPIFLAKTPVIDDLFSHFKSTQIGASGTKVGLTIGHQGSSEIGHLIMGAGRNVLLPQTMVKTAVESGNLFKNPAYKKAFENAKMNKSSVHMIGLLSDKGVHAYDTFCHALLKMAVKEGLADSVYVHVFADGRDVAPKSVEEFLRRLDQKKEELGIKRPIVASVMGRYFAMDRDHRWERTEKAFKTLVHGRADFEAHDAFDAVKKAYKRGETDEFIRPTIVLNEKQKPLAEIKKHDSVIHFNYRVDRAIQLSQAFVEKNFEGFPREEGISEVTFVATTKYYEGMDAPVAFNRPVVKNTLGEVLSNHQKTQLRISETEKWVYLTTIFNGIHEVTFEGEERVLIPSDKVATYDLAPQMQAQKIANTVIKKLDEDRFDAVFMNLANPDMLGHTGKKEAIIKGIEAVDEALGRVVHETLQREGTVFITADHGDAELCFDEESGQPHTSHTTADVPFIFATKDVRFSNASLRPNGILADIAPTFLDVMDLPVPKEMTGKTLITRKNE
ncbi:2,3-bisphosphoglycerate-independent phosphoglycerate mutase [Patescibacteria group bacterium]|nr:2,3-bisphosphoglycerate-independent phosphoglycerate mutase [Patescibacteria group bacterium]